MIVNPISWEVIYACRYHEVKRFIFRFLICYPLKCPFWWFLQLEKVMKNYNLFARTRITFLQIQSNHLKCYARLSRTWYAVLWIIGKWIMLRLVYIFSFAAKLGFNHCWIMVNNKSRHKMCLDKGQTATESLHS